ncbi:MAG: sugar transferase [Candidatus Omnitrophica bacterium]|nr:sugar transferase [Candidatus Omnitrophota bacterium]
MLKEHQSFLTRFLAVCDLAVILGCFFLGYFIRNQPYVINYIGDVSRTYSLETYYPILPYWVLFWLLALLLSGAYRPLQTRKIYSVLIPVLKAAVLATLLFGSLSYLLKIQHVSRSLISIICAMTWLGITVQRWIIFKAVRELYKKGFNTRVLLIVGTGPRALEFVTLIDKNPEWGLKIAGLVDDEKNRVGTEILSHRVLGTLADIPLLLENVVVDELVFIVPRSWLGRIEDSVLYAEQLGKKVSIAVDLFNMRFARALQRNIEKFPFLTFETTSNVVWQLFVKRLLDILFSLIGIAALSPLMLVTAVLIRSSSGGPILFRQTRCGLNGRLFTVYKFRTMVLDAEDRLESLRKQNEMSGPAFKMSNDPRLIKHGKWLRKFSIDELPQLFNILEGNMSFVGPRPPIPSEVKKYEPWQRRRLSLRPGLTCLWQVQGRSKIIRFEDWMKLDLEYIDTWSLGLDLKLFLKTIPIVILGIGAK